MIYLLLFVASFLLIFAVIDHHIYHLSLNATYLINIIKVKLNWFQIN